MEIHLINSLLTVQVDDADYPAISVHSWALARKRDKLYAVARINGRGVYLHRLIMGAPMFRVVDHIDGDGLNNRRSNLRICTRSQNMGNSRAHRDRSGEFKGVYYERDSGRYVAQICCRHRRTKIGRFPTPLDAARAYDAAAREAFGEFAKTNFPQRDAAEPWDRAG